MNRLALISKLKPDGTLKHRLVWDLRRSGVNMAIFCLMGTDVTEAFHQVPLHPSEQAYTVASVAGVFYVFRVLVFGSGSAPTVWGQIRCLLGKGCRSDLGTRSRKAAGLRGRPYLRCGGAGVPRMLLVFWQRPSCGPESQGSHSRGRKQSAGIHSGGSEHR